MKTQGQILQVFYQNFQKNKKTLSRRAFAKFLGVDPSRLHDFMSDKRVMTLQTAEQVCTRLQLEAPAAQEFQSVVSLQRARRKQKSQTIQVAAVNFQKIPGWHFFAILALADRVDFNFTPAAVADKLGISLGTAEEALKTLIETGFLTATEGSYVLNQTDPENTKRSDRYEISVQLICAK